MIKLNAVIEEALKKMDFVTRYEALSNEYNSDRLGNNCRLRYIDGEEVMETLNDLGYESDFDSKDKFYKTKEEQIGKYIVSTYIVLYNGTVELIWNVKDADEYILGMPWGEYSRLLIDADYIIKKPVFGSYEDLEDILRTAFLMYEDLKKVLVDK